MLTKKDKADIKDIVIDVIQDVVLPAFETVATKTDLKKVEDRLEGVENRLNTVENRLEVVERKLDRVVDNQLEDRARLSSFEKQVKKLESKRVLAPA